MIAVVPRPAPLEHLDSKANIRAALGCSTYERTIDGCRRVVAERDAARAEIEALRLAVRALWESNEDSSGSAESGAGNHPATAPSGAGVFGSAQPDELERRRA